MQQGQAQGVRQGRRLQLSLPHSFAFNFRESGPKTPEPREMDQAQPLEPPNPPKFRIRRRRAAPNAPSDLNTTSDELSLPTIQLPESTSDFASVLSLGPDLDLEEGLSEPASGTSRSAKRYGRIIAPPKTPLDQIFNSFDAAFGAPPPALTPQHSFDTLSGSPAAFSDSECDSDSSSDSTPSWEDDFGSPESDRPDPFIQLQGVPGGLSAPASLRVSQASMFRPSKHIDKTKWTPEMDEHLWATYMAYLADPKLTPFKMLPGTAPPLGVCHRVARDAKKNWKGITRSQPTPSDTEDERVDYMNLDAAVHREASAPATDPSYQPSFLMPGLHLPLGRRSQSPHTSSRKASGKWPTSEAATRRRLRQLCKRSPTLAAHYHRLVQTRTPSPFESSSSSDKPASSSRFDSPPRSDLDSAFSTRDLNITLATSTASSMQPDAPLHQLGQDGVWKPRPFSTEYARPAVRAGVHHRSQSLQLGLGLNNEPFDPKSFSQLASPFHEPIPQQADWIPSLPPAPPASTRMAPVQEDLEEGAQVKIHAPRPLSGSMKRRAEYPLGEEIVSNDPEKRRSMIQNLFRNSMDAGDTRLQARGFSMGAMRHPAGSRHLSDIFTPPQTILERSEQPAGNDESASATAESPLAQQMNTYRLNPPPHLAHINRLGSPFAPNTRLSRTFPRTAFPAGLDSITAMSEGHQQPQTTAHQLRQQQTMSWDGTRSPHSRFY